MHIHVFPMIAFQVACSVAESIAKLSGGMSSASGSGRVYPGEQNHLIFVRICLCDHTLSHTLLSCFNV